MQWTAAEIVHLFRGRSLWEEERFLMLIVLRRRHVSLPEGVARWVSPSTLTGAFAF